MQICDAFPGITSNIKKLSEQASETTYWESAYDFWIDVREKSEHELSGRQRAWLARIENDLVDPFDNRESAR